jgi:hypothetical protein
MQVAELGDDMRSDASEDESTLEPTLFITTLGSPGSQKSLPQCMLAGSRLVRYAHVGLFRAYSFTTSPTVRALTGYLYIGEGIGQQSSGNSLKSPTDRSEKRQENNIRPLFVANKGSE